MLRDDLVDRDEDDRDLLDRDFDEASDLEGVLDLDDCDLLLFLERDDPIERDDTRDDERPLVDERDFFLDFLGAILFYMTYNYDKKMDI